MAGKRQNAQSGPLTVGPVSDLERHLPPDWWRTLFNSLYLKTDGDVVENEANTAREVDALIRVAGLEVSDRILDLCCGQGRHSLELARRGFQHVTGVDRSRYLIRLARKRARSLGLTVSFHEGDARKFRLSEGPFHCVAIMGNSFGYFDQEEDDISVLEAVRRALIPGGILAMDLVDGVWMREHFEPRSWEWIDQAHFVCRERSLGSDGGRLVSREVVVNAELGVIADQFYAERLYGRERVEDLLNRVGFESVQFHQDLLAESDRGQDLGMMAHRMLLTGRAPRKAVSVPKRGPIWPRVTVVLGDPQRPDLLKRDGRFNPEDLDTINRLKAALADLTDYTFNYVDDHATLLASLRQNPPEFVLNFCDEGFRNDAFMEAHVPAILEMLDIPYSGAGPACLSLCYNKATVRALAASLDVPVPMETYFDVADQSATLPSVFPALVKPNFGDSSLGITADAIVNSPEEVITYIRNLQEELPGRPALVQEFLSGPEYSVAILGNPRLSMRVLPVLEVDYSGLDPSLPRILGYESKWLPDSPYWTDVKYREARLDEETRQQVMDWSMLLFERSGCRDYARFDWRTDSRGEIKLLEINPNPGWCWDGKLNFMAGFGGMRYADLLRAILEAAQERVAADLTKRGATLAAVSLLQTGPEPAGASEAPGALRLDNAKERQPQINGKSPVRVPDT